MITVSPERAARLLQDRKTLRGLSVDTQKALADVLIRTGNRSLICGVVNAAVKYETTLTPLTDDQKRDLHNISEFKRTGNKDEMKKIPVPKQEFVTTTIRSGIDNGVLQTLAQVNPAWIRAHEIPLTAEEKAALANYRPSGMLV